MAELITKGMRTAIKKMVQISQCARALALMPTPEDFALRLIGDMRIIVRSVNNISTRINEILDRYSSIPGELLLKGVDDLLRELNNINDYTKFAIQETTDLMSTTVKSTKEMTDAVGSATSAITSASLQIGGGLAYGTVALGANIKLAMTGNGRRKMTNAVVQDAVDGKIAMTDMQEEIDRRVDEGAGNWDDTANSIRDWTETSATNSTEKIDSAFEKTGEGLNKAVDWIDGQKEGADKVVDDTVGVLIEKVENAKREVEEKIQRVRDTFNKFTKDFDDAFGFINGKHFAEDTFRNMSNTAYDMGTPVYDEFGEVTGEVADFIKNFNIGKMVTALGGIVVGAGAASIAMDLLPSIDADKMLKDIIGGYDSKYVDKMTQLQYNKYYESEPDLLEVPDVPWRLSKDDLEKYNADGYNKYLEEYAEENDKARSEILEKMQTDLLNATSRAERKEVYKENRELMKENKSALKAMRKVRRDTIKARQIERYKGFLSIELEYLKKECAAMKTNIKNEWDTMMAQYKAALAEIKSFFCNEGGGGSETVDRCCDRINEDATKIVEMCQALPIQLVSTVSKVPCPYALGMCFDMPVHKILSFLMDLKIIITFIKDLIRLVLDIIAQIVIIIKLIFGGLQSLADMMKTLKDLIGVDKILNMVDYITALFKPKLAEAKILLENSISPIYYNETEDYDRRVSDIEEILDGDLTNKVDIESFSYTDDANARTKYKKIFGGRTQNEDEIEEWLEELEAKGEREIVAYRSPIMNDSGDDFAGWVFYHAYAYDYMNAGWRPTWKRRKNRLIKKASKKNKLSQGKLIGGVAQLKRDKSFGYYKDKNYVGNSVTGFDAYYWYTKWTNDPMDCEPDFDNVEFVYDDDGNLVYNENFNSNTVSPIQTTANGSLVEINDGNKTMRVFVEGKVVKSGDFVNVNGVKYRVK